MAFFYKNKANILTRVVNGRGESASPCVTNTDIIWKGWFSSTTVALVVDPTMKVVCSPGKIKKLQEIPISFFAVFAAFCVT